MGGGSNNCERSEQTERMREAFTGSRGLASWWGLQEAAPPCVRKFCILQAKYAYFQDLFGLTLQKYHDLGVTKGQLKFAS